MNTLQKDIAIIEALGGPSKVAELLHLPKKGGQQRVQNWLTRGIPASVKLDRLDLFLPWLMQGQSDPAGNPPQTPVTQAQAATQTVAQGVGHV